MPSIQQFAVSIGTSKSYAPAKLTSAFLSFDNSLVAGPKEIFLTDDLYEVGALQHLTGILVDSGKHERATLFMESFMQAMDGFEPSGVNE